MNEIVLQYFLKGTLRTTKYKSIIELFILSQQYANEEYDLVHEMILIHHYATSSFTFCIYKFKPERRCREGKLK